MDENYEKCIEYSTQAVVSDSWVKTLIFMGFPGVFVPKFQLRTGKNRMFWQPCWHQWHQWLIGFRQVETLTPPIFHEKTIVFLQIFSQSDPLLTVLATLLPDWQVLKLVAHVPEISDILVGYPFLKICRTGMIGYSYVLQQKIDKKFLATFIADRVRAPFLPTCWVSTHLERSIQRQKKKRWTTPKSLGKMMPYACIYSPLCIYT